MQQVRIRYVVDTIWEAINKAMCVGYISYSNTADYNFLGRLWAAQTEVRGSLLPRWPVMIQQSPNALVTSFEMVVNSMRLTNSSLSVTHVDVLKSALQHLDDDKMRPYWTVDSEFMKGRREFSGIVE